MRANFWRDSQGTCDCCGKTSKTIWGDISDAGGSHAVYYVQWTVDAAEHWPNIDLLVGAWGDGTSPSDRVHIAIRYHPGLDQFMVIDGPARRDGYKDLCARSLNRDEVIGTPLAQQVFSLLDALWLTEPRIEEVRALGRTR